jgi:dTDP-4-amino-4,6-dideoxygalactose transaminase
VETYAFATDFCKLSVLWFRVAEKLYSDGLCLPSGSNLNGGDDQRIAESLNLFLKCN